MDAAATPESARECIIHIWDTIGKCLCIQNKVLPDKKPELREDLECWASDWKTLMVSHISFFLLSFLLVLLLTTISRLK
jgi:hypothetical protein